MSRRNILSLILLLLTTVTYGQSAKIPSNIYIEENIIRNGMHGVNVVFDIETTSMLGRQIEVTAYLEKQQTRPVSFYSDEKYVGTVTAPLLQYFSFFIPTADLPDGKYTAHAEIYDLSSHPKKYLGYHMVRTIHLNKAAQSGRPQLDWSNIPSKTNTRPSTLSVSAAQAAPGTKLTMSVNGSKVAEAVTPHSVSVPGDKLRYGLNSLTVNDETRVVYFPRRAITGNMRVTNSTNNLGEPCVNFTFDLYSYETAGNEWGAQIWLADNNYHLLDNNSGQKVSSAFESIGKLDNNSCRKDITLTLPQNQIPTGFTDTSLMGYAVIYSYDPRFSNRWEEHSASWTDRFTPAKSNPNPTPDPVSDRTKPQLTWITCPSVSDTRQTEVRIGVRSTAPLTASSLWVNGTQLRGIKTVRNDGYDMVIRETVSLADGDNAVRVEVSNASGTTSETRSVRFNGNQPNRTVDTPAQQNPDKRIALVVGNARYPGQELRNTVNDAREIAATLKSLGFEVISVNDAERRQLEQKINEFGEKAHDYDVAMFFYAGHGIQHNGNNYLIPIDASLASESDIQYECTNVNRVLDKLEYSGCKMKIIALDACRNNPFERSWHRGTGRGRGLSAINAPVGTFISYATSPGNTAADGTGNHSPYTSALLNILEERDLPIETVFKKVAAKVFNATNHTQSPWYASSLYEGEFIFNPSAK